MKLKQIASLIIAAALCVSLAACGSSSSSAAASTGTASTGTGSTAASTGAADAGESNWPTDTVSFYVPATAGGGTDMMARLFLQGLNEVHPGNYIVVNDTTGNGSVAAETVRNADPDGLNLLMYHTGLCTAIATGQYAHTLDDFQILGLFITPVTDETTLAVYVPGNSPFNSLEELIDYAKEHPGELVSGVQNGSTSQFIEVLFEQAVGIETTMVEAGSNADKVTALMGNQLDLVLMNTTGNDQYVEAGNLKCLVTIGAEGAARSSLFPDVPTAEELGYTIPQLDMIGFIAGPKGMDEADIAAINSAMEAAIATDTVQEGYTQMAAEVVYVTIEEAEEMLATAQENYNNAVELING